MEGSNHGGRGHHQYPPHPQQEPYPYHYQYQQCPPPPPPQQQFAHHSGQLQPYPLQQPHQQHGYQSPSPAPYGYDAYPAYPPYPSPALSPISSFQHQPQPQATEPECPAAAASSSSLHYPITHVLANMSLSDRPGYAPAAVTSPSVLPPSASVSSVGSSHGCGAAAAGGSQHGGVRASLKVVLLHGSLDIWVHDARSLPNKDMFSKRVGDLLDPRITGSVGSKMSSGSMASDPYVTIQVSYATVARTYVIANSENPVWAQNFLVPIGHEAAEVEFVVKDSDVFGAQLIGAVAIPAEKLLSGDRIDGVYPVLEPNGKPCAPGAVLRLSIQYIPVARLTMYHHGIIAGPDCLGVPNTYFLLRRGMRVTLYQDAHVPDGLIMDCATNTGNAGVTCTMPYARHDG